jgi:hypothetical protein
LAKHPLWHAHQTPTSSSWLNQVERFFAKLAEKQIRRGVHRSVEELEAAITVFLDRHNVAPKPFRRAKSADAILATIGLRVYMQYDIVNFRLRTLKPFTLNMSHPILA